MKQTALFVNFLTETKTAPVGFQGPSRRTSYEGVHTAVPEIVLLKSVKEFLIMPTGIFVKCEFAADILKFTVIRRQQKNDYEFVYSWIIFFLFADTLRNSINQR